MRVRGACALALLATVALLRPPSVRADEATLAPCVINGDSNSDGVVNVEDLLSCLGAFGCTCIGCDTTAARPDVLPECALPDDSSVPPDFVIDVLDLLQVLGAFGCDCSNCGQGGTPGGTTDPTVEWYTDVAPVVAEIVLGLSFDDVDERWVQDFSMDIAMSLDIPADRIVVTSVEGGSIRVQFVILADANLGAAGASSSCCELCPCHVG